MKPEEEYLHLRDFNSGPGGCLPMFWLAVTVVVLLLVVYLLNNG